MAPVRELSAKEFGYGISAALQDRLTRAAVDFPTFAEFVMRTNEGASIRLAAIHRVWGLHIDACWAAGRYPGMLAPFAHAKSTINALGRVAWEVGRNLNLRTKVICNTDTRAMERVMGVSTLLQSPCYRAVFPKVRMVPRGSKGAGKQARWTQHELFVSRPGFSLDPTVQAAGVLASGTGGRSDLNIFDDVVDEKNAIQEPASRIKVVSAVDNVWMQRLEPSGRALLIGTVWHEADLHMQLLNRPAWTVLVQRVSEDFKRIEQEVYNPFEGYPLPFYQEIKRNGDLKARQAWV